MAKRRALKQLTQENADIDDDEEEAGQFQSADSDALASRTIRVAKRRIPGGSGNTSEGSTSSPFASFSGFSTAPKNAPFSFFSKTAAPSVETQSKVDTDSAVPKDAELLKSLNLSFLKWIKDHLEKNPYVVLIPVLKDYEKHLATLNLKSETGKSTLNSSVGLQEASASVSSTTFNNTISKPNPVQSSGFSFEKIAPPPSSVEPSKLSFGLNNGGVSSTTSAANMFSGFGGTGTFLPKSSAFPAVATQAAVAPQAGEDNEDASDEPPKFDFKPVGEEGSIFDIRCKIFEKKDGSFASAGVGILYLKPVANGKTQLITRADTSQGSVLLNLILTPDLPVQKTGKNNVLIVCIPTPEAKPPPVPVLIRVKSEEERDKLLSELDRLKGS